MRKIISRVEKTITKGYLKAKSVLADKRGDLATNTIGGIIVGVVVVGLLITAVNASFPGFFNQMFQGMSEKLASNW